MKIIENTTIYKCDFCKKELKENGNIYNGVKVYAYIHPANVFLKKFDEVVIRPLNRDEDAGAGKGVILFLKLRSE